MSQIVHDIACIARCGIQYRADHLASLGLKACHASYLTEICACPGISQDGLAHRIYFNKSNVARQVAALEEEGFITRTPSSSDKRVMELYPTEKTLEILPQLREVLQSWEACLVTDLTKKEKAQLSRLLTKMMPCAAAYMEER